MNISFAPPDITEKEIDAVVQVLKSGWITTGPKVKEFEENLSIYCGTEKALCLNSATAGMELVLRFFGVGEGDEVITTPYTFAATANVILHCGAVPVFADIQEDDFNISVEKISSLITSKTKAIIPVDFAGMPCDYQKIYQLVENKKNLFCAENPVQEKLGRVLVLSDAAHSFGSVYQGKKAGSWADFTVFSFHAVKNLTTAEGGAILFSSLGEIKSQEIYQKLKLFSLHGQSKDALDKFQAGNWFYSIDLPGYKYNMTDIAAAMGISQLERYEKDNLLPRKKIFQRYSQEIKGDYLFPLSETAEKETNYHLYPLRIKKGEERNRFVQYLAGKGIAANVHFIPLPMHSYYKSIGYKIEDYPVALKNFEREVSLPIYPQLTENQIRYLIHTINCF
ncbi:MAG TPA: capsular biosynthesis protein [Spirochaetia bacterium]|nr:MAG: capsular biosynthesis protein [Spirochaetes bacterium GWB1_36_13]HCL57705.1 capsular biosynthesis protein [Spirochaetia bacterium]